MKKLLMVAMLLVSCAALAETEVVDGIAWTYSVVSNAAVVGDVVTTNYTPAIKRDTAGAITIPGKLGGLPVVDIAPNAFSGCTNITSVTMPDSITNISAGAFSSIDITIPSTTTLIGYKTTTTTKGGTTIQEMTPICETVKAVEIHLHACEKLESVILSANIKVVRANAFGGCCNLMSVIFRGSVDIFENGAFLSCSKLKSLDLPAGIRCLGGGVSYVAQVVAGYKTQITTNGGTTTSTTSPVYSNVYHIANGGFPYEDCVVGVFADCTALESIRIPNSVVEIGPSAFSGCKALASLTIPDSVKYIYDGAFGGCISLTEFSIPNDATFPDPSESGLFFGCAKLRTVNIPEGISKLPNYAFANCVSLRTVNFAGDKPDVEGNELLVGTPTDMIVSVKGDAFGWYDPFTYGRLAMWQHRRVAYDGVLPKNAEEIDDETAREMLYATIETLNALGTALDESEKMEYLYAIQHIIDRHPSLLDCFSQAVNALGSGIDESAKTAFARWALSVASLRLNPASDPVAASEGDAVTIATEAKLTVTNVVLHYVVNSITPDLAVPITTDTALVNVMTEIKGGNISIPNAWATNYPAFVAAFGSDFGAALMKPSGKVDAGGKPMFVWQDYVAGTDPTDETDVFKASVTMVDGAPVISHTPQLKAAEAAKRKYVTWGKVKLQDENWIVVPSGSESDYNFFKVSVEMK